jgi:5-methylcytosine-specific restriction endonuclease McrA
VTWVRIDDRLPLSKKIKGLADSDATGDKAKRQRNEAIGHWLLILAACGSERSDGFVTATEAVEFGTSDSLARLLRSRFDRSPLLHRKGDVCGCLEGRKWPSDYDFAVHDWLVYNPSRSENDVVKAQRKELRDRELREAVRGRDGDCCRYCGIEVKWQDRKSPKGGVLDHVRPDLAAGADNLVVACRACNTRKGKRTPEAASMQLLPVPGHPRHPSRSATTSDQINGKSKTVSDPTSDRSQVDRLIGHGSDQKPDSDPAPGRPPPEPLREQATTSTDIPSSLLDAFPDATRVTVTGQIPSTGTDGPGRVGTGTRYVVGPPDTPRTSFNPNPYLRSAIEGPEPEEHAGLPPWPPGSAVMGAQQDPDSSEGGLRPPWT